MHLTPISQHLGRRLVNAIDIPRRPHDSLLGAGLQVKHHRVLGVHLMEGAQDTMADREAPHALDGAGLGRVVRQTRELGVEFPSKDGAVEGDSPLTVEDGDLGEADCRLAGDDGGVDIGNLITVCYCGVLAGGGTCGLTLEAWNSDGDAAML